MFLNKLGGLLRLTFKILDYSICVRLFINAKYHANLLAQKSHVTIALNSTQLLYQRNKFAGLKIWHSRVKRQNYYSLQKVSSNGIRLCLHFT